MANCDPLQKVETSYCCKTINETFTQDGLHGTCDCNATGGTSQPLHFEGHASVITTIGMVASSSRRSLSTRRATTTKTTSPVRSLSSSVSAISPTSSTSKETTTLPSPSPSSLPSNKRTVAIGAGVGTSLAVLFVGFLAFCLYRKRAHPRSDQTSLAPLAFPPVTPLSQRLPVLPHVPPLANPGEQEMMPSLSAPASPPSEILARPHDASAGESSSSSSELRGDKVKS